MNDIKILVATYSPEFYKIIYTNLQGKSGSYPIVQLKSLRDVEAKLNKAGANVLILDVDNIVGTYDFLKKIIEKYKFKVILTGNSSTSAIVFMKGEIRDYIPKPLLSNHFAIQNYCQSILKKIATFLLPNTTRLNLVEQQKTVDVDQKIITIASSTGGTDALEKILRSLPADIPPILIVQHMTSGFTRLFADRLNNICTVEIKEASNNDHLRKGLVLIAPSDSHMKLVRRNSRLLVECFVGQRIHGVMPAADVLFESIAPIMRANAVGVILTGMGADGARGLLSMHINGAKTIGQNKETCVVYGMPKVAFDIGAIDYELPLDRISEKMLSL